jgi:preprotein translocase subunit SecY
MLNALTNVFRIQELRNKVLFTIGMLMVYRIGHWIPLPGVNQEEMVKHFAQAAPGTQSTVQRVADFVAIFSGGALSKSTIFGLGIMPYITASIIFQLVATVSPQLKKLQEEGPTGRQKIMEFTRYAAVGLCIFQSVAWLKYLQSLHMVYTEWAGNPLWWVVAATALTAGTVFLMWLGEQIDKYGIGNGVSMIIMAGILTRMPSAVTWVWDNFKPGDPSKMGWLGLIVLVGGFVAVVGGSVLMTVAQRRIPVQQAKHTRGRKVFGGQKSYLPLRINHGGVMPIVFASSLMIIPTIILGGLKGLFDTAGTGQSVVTWIDSQLQHGQFLYCLLYILMVYFFSYFWITVQFNPEEMSKQLKEHGSFIPGLRPGPRTAEYLETVMNRITYVGAAFLSVLAILPMVVQGSLNISPEVTQFLGGTGLLIVVSVCLDFLQRVEANLLMRNYSGFLASGEDATGPKLKSARFS